MKDSVPKLLVGVAVQTPDARAVDAPRHAPATTSTAKSTRSLMTPLPSHVKQAGVPLLHSARCQDDVTFPRSTPRIDSKQSAAPQNATRTGTCRVNPGRR